MTLKQISDIVDNTVEFQKTHTGNMSEAFYHASLKGGALEGEFSVESFAEVLKTKDTISAFILQDFEFMTHIEGPHNERGHVLMFDDLSFFVFDQDNAFDPDMRGELSWLEGGFKQARPTEDMQIIAATKLVPVENLQAVDADEGADFRDALCEAIADIHDPIINIDDSVAHENWSADQQEEIELWVLRAAAALQLPVPLHIMIDSSFEKMPANVDVGPVGDMREKELPPFDKIGEFLKEVLEHTMGLSEFEGGSYEYADGSFERKSGYAAVAATIFSGDFNPADISNHERLNATEIFTRALAKSDIAKGDFETIMKMLEDIKSAKPEVRYV